MVLMISTTSTARDFIGADHVVVFMPHSLALRASGFGPPGLSISMVDPQCCKRIGAYAWLSWIKETRGERSCPGGSLECVNRREMWWRWREKREDRRQTARWKSREFHSLRTLFWRSQAGRCSDFRLSPPVAHKRRQQNSVLSQYIWI